MTKSRSGRGYGCVVVDLNTQADYLDPGGGCAVQNHAELIPALRRMIAWVKRNEVPVVSSIESHRPCEVAGNGHPRCCVDGTPGQHKLEFTLFPRRVTVEVDNTFAMPMDLFKHWQQVLFRKRSEDLLANPKADRFLTYLPVGQIVIFGIGLERAIKALVLGLLAREKSVAIVTDACGYWHKPTADLTLRQMSAKGAALITLDELKHKKLRRHRRYRPVHATPESAQRNGKLIRQGLTPGRGPADSMLRRTRGRSHPSPADYHI